MTASIVVAPPNLCFHSSEPEQKFEIFNVHQHPVKFVVKATAPEKYIISNTEGMINTQCKVSITVTHVDVCVTNENVRDKFRIYFSLLKNKKLEAIGHRDVSAVLYAQKKASPMRAEGGSITTSTTTTSSSSSSPARRSSHPSSASSRSVVAQSPLSVSEVPPPDAVHGHNLLVYLVPMVLGVAALWLPTQDSVPGTPWYLELSVVTKHTICFFLGVLVTLFYKRVQQTER
ncbi:motile sperm domain-containing protein 1-like [Babylonia areolata]|uniref:motile sperm domain-containing protein 1-like n=1 Tax=Babylonia areolata TaxID=304850 RepID=UPI003FD6252D